MRRNPASQILHADTVDLLEETLAKKLPLLRIYQTTTTTPATSNTQTSTQIDTLNLSTLISAACR